jgi:hypothetical protein
MVYPAFSGQLTKFGGGVCGRTGKMRVGVDVRRERGKEIPVPRVSAEGIRAIIN